MSEQLYKLSPDRDLQAYFLMPSAIAAMSSASSSGFTLSGKWRQQFDWAVVEWNRDNTFEHPALRYLPDGDLSGLTLSYIEERDGCIPIASNLYPVVAWNKLRLWIPQDDGSDVVYYVDIAKHSTAVEGVTVPASATMTLVSLPVGKHVGLAFLEEHYYYTVGGSDTLETAAQGLASVISSFSATSNFTATSHGASVILTWNPNSTQYPLNGANGNRLTVYGFSQGSIPVWQSPAAAFGGGSFPTKYQVTFDFGNLVGYTDNDPKEQPVPTQNVRKVRWTWAADLQPSEFVQTEFSANISNWIVTGSNRQYQIAGPGSRRIEDSDDSVVYSGTWQRDTGNYSGSKVHSTSTKGDSLTVVYQEGASHELYAGVRRTPSSPDVTVVVDGQTVPALKLALAGEDILVRYHLGSLAAGPHTVTLTNGGGGTFYFDFLEIAYPSTNLPDFKPNSQLSLATDWDTYHSQSLPAERTAWLINKLGFHGRVNHYTGALWFYEIVRTGTVYASLTVTLNLAANHGSPYVQFGLAPTVKGLNDKDQTTVISHLVLPDDNSSTVATAIAALINVGTNLVWASANGNQLTVTARAMGKLGNNIGFALTSKSDEFSVNASSQALGGGIDGTPYDLVSDNGGVNDTFMAAAQLWRTDLTATNPINRAARDWHSAFFTALKGYGLDAVAAFSTELGNGDPSSAVGMAQRYPDATAVVVNTPAIQTNFSPSSITFWTNVYLSMATIQNQAGLTPYLQSGEVQWWYFPKAGVGMTFYDDYTRQQFQAKYGVAMQTILSNTSDPSLYPNEVAFLPTLIGNYTVAIRSALQKTFPNCRYEILYPTDTNDTALNSLVNYPTGDWTPQNLTCLKTESFGFTGGYNLVNCEMSMGTSAQKGFPNNQRSHLVGIGDAWSTWLKEVDIAQSNGLETVVLFALDQYCLIGYPPPPFVTTLNSRRQG